MVYRKSIKKTYALISVFDKTNLSYLCKNLKKYDIQIISTGSTYKKINQLGYKCLKVSNITKFKEILNGRVKTLHPKIHASILYKRNNINHINTFNNLNFPSIDYVIVNLYPFNKVLKKTKDENKLTEMIDIGGVALLRSSAKNFKFITTICDLNNYKNLIKNLSLNKGKTSINFRKKMALKVFNTSSKYDKKIFEWMKNYTKYKKKKGIKKIKLKYGENPDQGSYFIPNKKDNIFDKKLQGKNLGYNNILDISEGLKCLNEFSEPTCIIIKHNNPCGVASANSIKKAFDKAYKADTVSAFGGIVLLNRVIDNKLSKLMINHFFEVIVAKDFTKSSRLNFASKPNLILIESSKLNFFNKKEIKTVIGGTLVQNNSNIDISNQKIKLVSKKKSNKKKLQDLLFAFKIAKHTKSNSIVLVNNKQTIGIGAGQMSRYDSVRIALIKKMENFPDIKFVCASDAFFPFTDSLKLLLKNKCTAIVQPFGSKNDNEIINFATNNKLSLYFTSIRVFKH